MNHICKCHKCEQYAFERARVNNSPMEELCTFIFLFNIPYDDVCYSIFSLLFIKSLFPVEQQNTDTRMAHQESVLPYRRAEIPWNSQAGNATQFLLTRFTPSSTVFSQNLASKEAGWKYSSRNRTMYGNLDSYRDFPLQICVDCPYDELGTYRILTWELRRIVDFHSTFRW